MDGPPFLFVLQPGNWRPQVTIRPGSASMRRIVYACVLLIPLLLALPAIKIVTSLNRASLNRTLLNKTMSSGGWANDDAPVYTAFKDPERVAIRGYDDDAMEPFLTRDGHYLFFNNRNDPSVNTNLHYAERINDTTFAYRGEIGGVNTAALEGVPSMDRLGNFYFVSTRSYDATLSTLYWGKWLNGRVNNVALVSGIAKRQRGSVNFDAEISADGNTLYFVDGVFEGGPVPKAADIAIATRQGDGFHRLTNSEEILSRINTDQLEYAPATSADELELFFTRLDPVHKHIGIYRTARTAKSDAFSAPERVAAITEFAEGPKISADGRSLYYHVKEGERFVIYRVRR